jgi:hypothetical protein
VLLVGHGHLLPDPNRIKGIHVRGSISLLDQRKSSFRQIKFEFLQVISLRLFVRLYSLRPLHERFYKYPTRFKKPANLASAHFSG